MKTTNQKEAVASHAGSTVATNTAINALAEHFSISAQTSIAQTIAQAFGDNTMPPQPGLSASGLPSTFHNPGLDNLAAHFADTSSNDPSKASDHTDPLSSIAADAAAAMARLTGMDPANHPDDPTQKTGINIGPGLPSAEALKAALAQDGIIVNTGSGTVTGSEPSKGDGEAVNLFSGHLEQPNDAPQERQQSKEESMLADNWSYNYKDAQGHEHQRDMYTEKGYFSVSDKDKKTGEQTDTIIMVNKKDTVTIERHSDPKTGETTETTTHTNGRDTHVTVTDTKTGEVKKDGTQPAEVPLEPLHNDHKSGGGAKMPDGDHQSALPSWLANQIHNEISREMKTEHPGNHDDDTINVRNDGPDTASANDLTGTHGDKMKSLLGGDTTLESSQQDGHFGGTPQTNYNGQAGAIDHGPDSDLPSQSNGPMPKDHHNPTPNMGAGGHESSGNGDGQNTHQTLPPIGHLTAATMQDLVQAYEASHSDDHKTAQSVGADHTSHDIASLLGGATAPHDSHDDFAAVIHFANNPQQFGLVATAARHGAEVSSLSMHDAVGHLSEVHVDVTHFAALSVVDDHHIGLPALEAFHALHL